MRRLITIAIMGSLAVAASAWADNNQTQPWNFHKNPFSFLFGNHIDTHQQMMLNKDGSLSGFLYVTRVVTNGVPARTPDGTPLFAHCLVPSDYPTCQAGWTLTAYPCIKEINGCTATFEWHNNDHPVWLIGDRNMVPQPGRPTHFHWLTRGSTMNGTVMPSTIASIENLFHVSINVDPACNVATPEELIRGVSCPGYFLELTVDAVNAIAPTNAGTEWAWLHDTGEAIFLFPGPDMRSHINYVTSVPTSFP